MFWLRIGIYGDQEPWKEFNGKGNDGGRFISDDGKWRSRSDARDDGLISGLRVRRARINSLTRAQVFSEFASAHS